MRQRLIRGLFIVGCAALLSVALYAIWRWRMSFVQLIAPYAVLTLIGLALGLLVVVILYWIAHMEDWM
jgi:hypothetical protein